MDVETENVIRLIYPEGIPENWKENPDFSQYLSKLGSYGVEQLRKEPDRLNEEKVAVLEQTQDLAFSNYKTFIQTAECSREIFKQFSHTEQRLNSLMERLPEFTQRCQEFSQASSDINLHRRLNSLTLTRNAQLLEILELPQLMDTCIRNGSYEEALELAGYVRRLGKRHGQIPIIASIVADVEAAWLTMLHQLLAQLRTDLQLPRCLQVVGYLRRMDLFSEAELRLKFLQTRDSWLQSLLSEIPKDDASQHLSKTIELSRINLFNIVTQYRAIFSDDDPVIPVTKDSHVSEGTILYCWIQEKVWEFLATLEQDLARGVGGSLDSIVGQCMYFGLSFSRVGADFRGLMAPIFVDTVTHNLEHAVRKATKRFEQDMSAYRMYRTVPPSRGLQPAKQEQPPSSLLEFHPLADYCNALLSALNSLRLCAPVSVAEKAAQLLRESLSTVSRTVLVAYRQEQPAPDSAERESFSRLCQCIATDLVPFLQRCLHAVFPPATVAGLLGVSPQRLQTEGITYFDQAAILDPIMHLLPVRLDPPVTSAITDVSSSTIITAASDGETNTTVSQLPNQQDQVTECETDKQSTTNEPLGMVSDIQVTL